MSSLRDTPHYDRLTKQLTDRDFLFDVALGRVPNYGLDLLTGLATGLTVGIESTIMDYPNRRIVFPTGLVNVYASSTNPADTSGIVIAALGVSNVQILLQGVNLTGQTPVLVGQLTHLQLARLTGATPIGNVYFSSEDNHTGGIPNDLNKLLSYIPAGKNITSNGWYKVPHEMNGITIAIRGNTDDDAKPAVVKTIITMPEDIPVYSVAYSVSTSFPQLLFPCPIAASTSYGVVSRVLPEGSLIEFTAKPKANNTEIFLGSDIVLVHNKEFGGQPID